MMSLFILVYNMKIVLLLLQKGYILKYWLSAKNSYKETLKKLKKGKVKSIFIQVKIEYMNNVEYKYNLCTKN